MIWILISVLITIIDQLTKYFVLQNIELGELIPVIDKFFYLTLHMNSGAAFSILKDGRPFFLIITPIVAIFAVIVLFKSQSKFLRFSLALILGGTIGNYIDRLVSGEVTDFLLFYIGSYPFPVFNVADITLTCGTILVAIYVIFIYKEPDKNHETSAASAAGTYTDKGAQVEADVETQVNVDAVAQADMETNIESGVGLEDTVAEDSNEDA